MSSTAGSRLRPSLSHFHPCPRSHPAFQASNFLRARSESKPTWCLVVSRSEVEAVTDHIQPRRAQTQKNARIECRRMMDDCCQGLSNEMDVQTIHVHGHYQFYKVWITISELANFGFRYPEAMERTWSWGGQMILPGLNMWRHRIRSMTSMLVSFHPKTPRPLLQR